MANRGFLVLVSETAPGRRVHRRGRVRWRPAGLVEDEGLADAMARLLCERSPSVKTRVVPSADLTADLGGAAAEGIFDRLYNRTTAEIAWSQDLEREAAERLKGKSDLGREPPRPIERRSGVERRRGERRQAIAAGLTAGEIPSVERRKSVERRSGVDRRDSSRSRPEMPPTGFEPVRRP